MRPVAFTSEAQSKQHHTTLTAEVVCLKPEVRLKKTKVGVGGGEETQMLTTVMKKKKKKKN